MAGHGVATVFGGSGFIGRYVVKRLAQRGHVVRIAVRDPEDAQFLRTMGKVGQIVPLAAPVTDEAAVALAVNGAEMVVNLVGILAETKTASFQAIHADGAGRVARLSAAAGVDRLVHLSAIGADPSSPSRYAATKAAGELAVRQAFPGVTILRPSVVFGPEDHFFNRFAGMARMLPLMPVISGATKMQPVHVGDVADAVMAALTRADAVGGVYELGGPRVWSFREILAYILKETGHQRPMIALPMGLVRLQALILEKLPGKLLTRDQLLLLARDNVVTAGMPGLTDLGLVPTPVELVVPAYLRRFRPGGGRRMLTPEVTVSH